MVPFVSVPLQTLQVGIDAIDPPLEDSEASRAELAQPAPRRETGSRFCLLLLLSNMPCGELESVLVISEMYEATGQS